MSAKETLVKHELAKIKQSKKVVSLENTVGKRLSFVFLGGAETLKLLIRLTEDRYVDYYISSLGVDHKDVDLFYDKEKYEISDSQIHRLQLWDNTSNKPSEYRNTHSYIAPKLGYVIGIDINDPQSVNHARQLFEQIEKYGNSQAKEQIIIVGIDNSKNPELNFDYESSQQQKSLTYESAPKSILYHDSPIAPVQKISIGEIKHIANSNGVKKENVLMVSARTGANCDILLLRLGTISIEEAMTANRLQDDENVLTTGPNTKTPKNGCSIM